MLLRIQLKVSVESSKRNAGYCIMISSPEGGIGLTDIESLPMLPPINLNPLSSVLAGVSEVMIISSI